MSFSRRQITAPVPTSFFSEFRTLKKKMQREGVFREIKLRRHFEKPSEKRVREASEAVRRTRKLLRKRLEREGY